MTHAAWLNKVKQIKAWPAIRPNAALSALLLQVVAFALVSAAYAALSWCGLEMSVYMLFVLQALFALALSCAVAGALWWRYIHAGFPLAILLVLEFPLPQSFYTAGLIITVGLYWTTFRSQVPFFPSASSVEQQLLRLIPERKALRVMDIGSGVGGLMMHMARQRPDARFFGIEIAPIPWLISVCRSKLNKSGAVFSYGDYQRLDFAQFDVIYAYLSPAVMSAIWQKARSEMRPGTLLLSYEFAIDSVPATQVLQTAPDAPFLYIWRM